MGYAALAALEPVEDTSISTQLGVLHAGNGHHRPPLEGEPPPPPDEYAARARAVDACRDESLSFYGESMLRNRSRSVAAH